MKIGIDFGGVIVRASEGESFDPRVGVSIVVDEAIPSIKSLILAHEVYIISKASRRVQSYTREWLSNVEFYQSTGFMPQNLYFCEKRADKADICRRLMLDWFIDDSEEVIASLTNVVTNRIHFNHQSNWSDVLEKIRASKD